MALEPPCIQVGVVQALGGSPGSRALDTWEFLESVKVSGRFRTVQCDKWCSFWITALVSSASLLLWSTTNFCINIRKLTFFNDIYEVPWPEKTFQNNCSHVPTVHVSRARGK